MKRMKKTFLLSLLSATLLLFGCAPNQASSVEAPSSPETISSVEEPSKPQSDQPSSEKPIGVSSETPASPEQPVSVEQPGQSSIPSGNSSYATPTVPERWKGVSFRQYGVNFRDTLGALITGNTASYNACLEIGARVSVLPLTASIPTSMGYSSKFVPFYKSWTEASSLTTIGSCNREHTWPKSRGGNMIENDPIVIRPTISADNSARGNNNYGIATGEWDPASCGYEGARGEAARVILYAATRYGKSKGLKLYNTKVTDHGMGTLKTLLEWNRKYAPSAFEQKVNDRFEQLGYARNPFVDYPDFANYIWDDNGLRTTAYVSDYVVPETSDVSYDISIPEQQESEENGFSAAMELVNTDFPNSYDKTETARTIKGVDWKTYYVGNFSSSIQLKNGEGYFYNVSKLNYDTLVISITNGSPVVYGGESMNPNSVIEPTSSGSSKAYDISDYPYIKIFAGTGSVANLSSVSFA